MASLLALVGLMILGCENGDSELDDIPHTQPPISEPPVADPNPAQRHGAGSGVMVDPGPASPITVPDGTTTTNP